MKFLLALQLLFLSLPLFADCKDLARKQEKSCISLRDNLKRMYKSRSCDFLTADEKEICDGILEGLSSARCENLESIISIKICEGLSFGMEFSNCSGIFPNPKDPENYKKSSCLSINKKRNCRIEEHGVKGLNLCSALQEVGIRKIEKSLKGNQCLLPQIPKIVAGKKLEVKEATSLAYLDRKYRGENYGKYMGDEYWKVEYLSTPQDLAIYKMVIKNGNIVRSKTKRNFNTNAGMRVGHASIFVLDAKENLYISDNEEKGKHHHSSLAAGGPVIFAGEIEVREGKIRYISNGSGHYLPTKENFLKFLEYLRKNDVDLRGVEIEIISGQSTVKKRLRF